MDKSYFVGKLCSVFTTPTNRDFKLENPKTFPEPIYQYFIGVVEAIDTEGIFLTQASTGCKSYFNLNNIIGICEEQVISEADPEFEEVTGKFKEAKKDALKKLKVHKKEDTPTEKYVDASSLKDLIEKAENCVAGEVK